MNDMAALRYLLNAYFHQDFDLDGGQSADTVAAFLHERSTLTSACADEIDQLLNQQFAEGELSFQLHEWGSEYRAGDDDSAYRSWLVEVRDQIRANITE